MIEARVARLRILLAEDETGLRTVIAEMLRHQGFDVVTVDNGLAACEAGAQQSFDALVFDHDMPELSGLEALRRLRAGGCQVPALLLSGSTEVTAAAATSLGVHAVLGKPIRTVTLAQRIREAVATATAPVRRSGHG